MLEEGNDRKAAAQQIELLLTAAKFLRGLDVNYRVSGQEMKFDMALSFEGD